MDTCEVCGNDYPNPLKIEKDGRTHTFDSFECAIHALAPRCAHCGCTVIGHGREAEGRIYCCEHCQRMQPKMTEASGGEHASHV